MKYMGKTVLLAATSLLLLTGCDEDARNTIEGVVEAAQAQDLDAYRSHFEGEALEAFGTEEAMNQVV